MNDKNFLNLHVLISHSPSCLNRDDMNMQKSAIFGGARRVRVSSQSLKRAIRRSEYYQAHVGIASDRTRDMALLKDKYVTALQDRFSADLVRKTIALVVGQSSAEDADESETKKDKKIAVAPWSIGEVARLCEIIAQAEADGETALTESEQQKAEKSAKTAHKKITDDSVTFEAILEEKQNEIIAKKLEKIIKHEKQSLLAALAQTPDIALSGRMATSGLMTSIDGALSLAHAITTHAVDADIDWFTAVDDLIADRGDTGSGHLDTQEFSAGVFYRYASVNLRQLQDNLGGADRAQALQLASQLAHLLATVVPQAKQHSFAAHNPADWVLASFGDMPISAANAFEKPIPVDKKNGFLGPSIQAFVDYWQGVYAGYGLEDRYAVFSLRETILAPRLATLPALENWIANDGRD